MLALYVLLLKVDENNKVVVYKYEPNEKAMGKIEPNKLTGEFSELEAISDSDIPTTFYFDRAAQRLAYLMREGGIFPERTAFES